MLSLSFFDALFTDVGLQHGVIEEGNPFAKFLYEIHWIAFYGWKLLLPLFLIWIYPLAASHRAVPIAMKTAVFIYAFLLIYHSCWLILAIRQQAFLNNYTY
nr:DUF5658 family protein [Bacillus ectoiniformans]